MGPPEADAEAGFQDSLGGESRGEEVGSTRGGLGDTIDTFKDYPAWREGKLGGLQLSVSLPGAPWALTRVAPGGPQRAQGAKCSGTHRAPGWRDRRRRCSSAPGPGPCAEAPAAESRSWRRREAEILASPGSASWLPPKCEIAQARGDGEPVEPGTGACEPSSAAGFWELTGLKSKVSAGSPWPRLAARELPADLQGREHPDTSGVVRGALAGA